MKTTKHFITAILLLFVAFSYSQDYAYVNADSGLTVRERPDIGASKLGKLMYNEAVEIIEKTDVKLVVIDQGNKVSGEWVKIKMNGYQDLKGYVFNGFLSENKLAKIVNIKLAEADIHIKNLSIYNDDELLDLTTKNSLNIGIHVKNTPGKKTIEVKNNNYKSVKILQRYQNTLNIIGEDLRCDLSEWKQYESEWKPIKKINNTRFQTLTYTEADAKQFVPISIENLKAIVTEKCGEDWSKRIDKISNINQFPISVDTNEVFLKFILTDFDDNVTEKTVTFTVPKHEK
ncbi:SH3 domain-containing protein [uncultured Lacinutrix sp.]|uniref:SH3 domain-containing protein n=1 Tax=uncultured Lacinutrix sp. TaxID=574032 RepID=UPI002633FB59|nr:SH3 domain-containing protein [uncultured Lacinutrix sp.]